VDAVADEGENAYRWYYVDLPGYGYAKAAKSDRDTWLRFIDEYLQSPSPRQCWQLVDIRHAPSKEDISMHQILRDAGFDLQVIANKADKISRGAWAKSLKEISKALEIKSSEIIVFSAMSKEGKDTLLKKTEDFLLSGGKSQLLVGTNTTIGAVLTDVALDKAQANRLATVAHDGYARAIHPVHTQSDGDTIFALSCGDKQENFVILCTAAAKAMAQAIRNAVTRGERL